MGLSGQQWDKIERLLYAPSYHFLDCVPHRGTTESFLRFYHYAHRAILPQFIDRYAFICLTALYTWTNYVEIIPGKTKRGDEYPTVIAGRDNEDDICGVEADAHDVHCLIRELLSGKRSARTRIRHKLTGNPRTRIYMFLESRDILVEVENDFTAITVTFYGLGAKEEHLIQSLADANGLFLKHTVEERTIEEAMNQTMPTVYPSTMRTISSLVRPDRLGGFPETDSCGGS